MSNKKHKQDSWMKVFHREFTIIIEWLWDFLDMTLMIMGGGALFVTLNIFLFTIIALVLADGGIGNNLSLIIATYSTMLSEYKELIIIASICIFYFIAKVIDLEISFR